MSRFNPLTNIDINFLIHKTSQIISKYTSITEHSIMTITKSYLDFFLEQSLTSHLSFSSAKKLSVLQPTVFLSSSSSTWKGCQKILTLAIPLKIISQFWTAAAIGLFFKPMHAWHCMRFTHNTQTVIFYVIILYSH